jgi:hypothetical protein
MIIAVFLQYELEIHLICLQPSVKIRNDELKSILKMRLQVKPHASSKICAKHEKLLFLKTLYIK